MTLDACHSGGFWGDHNANDQGDLEKLNNISMIAAAAEDKTTYYIKEPEEHPDLGKNILGINLKWAWTKTDEDLITSDLDEDGTLTFHELVDWLKNESPVKKGLMDGIVVAEADFGDISIFSSGMWNPVAEKSDDFVGVLITDTPDSPSAKANGPYSGSVGLPITFDATGSSTPNGDMVLYEWDWSNDGIYDECTTSPTTAHTWNEIFNGTVRLRVTDSEGLTDIDSASVEVQDPNDVDDDEDGYTENEGDCDDNDANIHPGAEEICGDGIDNNCNGQIDENCAIPGDLDGDGDIDNADYSLFRSTLGKCAGADGFIADADYDGDGCITYADYRIWYGYYRNQ